MRLKKPHGDLAATRKRPDWLGGFIRETKRGKPIFVIEKRIRGVLFKASTRCHTEDAALKEYRKFEADPGGYRAGGVERLLMTPELVIEYCDWMEAKPPVGRGNTHEWVLQTGRFLRDWLIAFGGADLRRISLTEHVKPVLPGWKSSHHGRVVALKGFFTWLRKEKGVLKHFEDPMPDMRIPQGKAAKETSTGARDRPFDAVKKVYRQLRSDVRDILLLLSGTGWHLTEVMRFAQSGEIRKDPTGRTLATLVTFHKMRERNPTGITHQEHLDAARRIREKGYTLSRPTLDRLIFRANKELGITARSERVTFGSMRHNVGNWALEDGEDIETTAKAFNHTDTKMLKRHYLRHAVARATIKTRVLK